MAVGGFRLPLPGLLELFTALLQKSVRSSVAELRNRIEWNRNNFCDLTLPLLRVTTLDTPKLPSSIVSVVDKFTVRHFKNLLLWSMYALQLSFEIE